MAQGKKSFIAYCDWMETFESLPDDKAGQLVKHLFRYVNDMNPKTDDLLINAVFVNIKQTLKRDLDKWDKFIEKQKINGAKGGRPKKAKKPKPNFKNPNKPKKADNVSVSVNVNDNIPIYIDFEKFVLEKEPLINKTALKHKYDAWIENGWKDGNNKPIKNWKTKILNTLPYIAKQEQKRIMP